MIMIMIMIICRVMSTSQKHRLFMAEPIGSKRVTDLPGIGMVFGRRLEDKHFTHVSDFVSALVS